MQKTEPAGRRSLALFQPGSGALRSRAVFPFFYVMSMGYSCGATSTVPVSFQEHDDSRPYGLGNSPAYENPTARSQDVGELIQASVVKRWSRCLLRLTPEQIRYSEYSSCYDYGNSSTSTDVQIFVKSKDCADSRWIDALLSSLQTFMSAVCVDAVEQLKTVRPRELSMKEPHNTPLYMSPMHALRTLCSYLLYHDQAVAFLLVGLAITTVLMYTVGQAYDSVTTLQKKMPPVWGPHMRHEYPFKKYYEDMSEWLLMTEIPTPQQAFYVRKQLKGTARKLIDRMSKPEMLVGGFGHDGQWRDPVPLLMDTLRIRFGELQDERRLVPIFKLMAFARKPGEMFSEMMAR